MVIEAVRAFPGETGGILLGYWAVPDREVVITTKIGPGPKALHEPRRFVPDADYQEAELARRYALDRARFTYLGDWHSHPLGTRRLSRLDRRTLRQIASYADARAPNPLMAILTPGAESMTWEIAVWHFRSRQARIGTRRAEISLLQLRSFQNFSDDGRGAIE